VTNDRPVSRKDFDERQNKIRGRHYANAAFTPDTCFKVPKFTHTTPILKSLHWLKINQRIEYKILSLTYIKFLITTVQTGYLRNLIFIELPFTVTRSSSSVTLSRPSSSSSVKITDRSFRYASPCLWNKLPASFRQPNSDHSFSHSSQPNCLSSSAVPSLPLSLSITPTLFHSKLKRYIFLKFFPP